VARAADVEPIHRIGVWHTLGESRLGSEEFLPEPVGEPGHDLVLHVEEIGPPVRLTTRP
jgi:hypothetical protein